MYIFPNKEKRSKIYSNQMKKKPEIAKAITENLPVQSGTRNKSIHFIITHEHTKFTFNCHNC